MHTTEKKYFNFVILKVSRHFFVELIVASLHIYILKFVGGRLDRWIDG